MTNLTKRAVTRFPPAAIAFVVGSLLGCLGCSDDPSGPGTEEPLAEGAIVSNPVQASFAAGAKASLAMVGSTGDGVTYVSLPSGTLPAGRVATIRLRRYSAWDGVLLGIEWQRRAWRWIDQRQGSPRTGEGGLNFVALSAGVRQSTTCGLTATGAAYCWGGNEWGQIGDGSTTNRSVPSAVSGALLFSSLSAGGAHTCAVTTTASAFCWGSGIAGGLGHGTADSTVLVKVAGQP